MIGWAFAHHTECWLWRCSACASSNCVSSSSSVAFCCPSVQNPCQPSGWVPFPVSEHGLNWNNTRDLTSAIGSHREQHLRPWPPHVPADHCAVQSTRSLAVCMWPAGQFQLQWWPYVIGDVSNEQRACHAVHYFNRLLPFTWSTFTQSLFVVQRSVQGQIRQDSQELLVHFLVVSVVTVRLPPHLIRTSEGRTAYILSICHSKRLQERKRWGCVWQWRRNCSCTTGRTGTFTSCRCVSQHAVMYAVVFFQSFWQIYLSCVFFLSARVTLVLQIFQSPWPGVETPSVLVSSETITFFGCVVWHFLQLYFGRMM